MTSPERSLHPASGDDGRPPLSAHEFVARGGMQLAQVVRAVVGPCVSLEPGPQVFDRIQIWGIGRKEGDLDVSVQRIQVVAHQATSMRFQSIPDHQQRLLEMGLQSLEEFDDLLLLDASLVQSKHAVGARAARDDREGDRRSVERGDRTRESSRARWRAIDPVAALDRSRLHGCAGPRDPARRHLLRDVAGKRTGPHWRSVVPCECFSCAREIPVEA